MSRKIVETKLSNRNQITKLFCFWTNYVKKFTNKSLNKDEKNEVVYFHVYFLYKLDH